MSNLMLNFSDVFNYNLTLRRNETFDENSILQEFENIYYLLKIFSNHYDKYKAFTHFIKNSQYGFCEDFICQYEVFISFKRFEIVLFRYDGSRTFRVDKKCFRQPERSEK